MAASPAISTSQRSHGSQSGVLSSSTNDHQAVTATATAAHTRPAIPSRACHRLVAPTPTSAPIAGPRATM